MAASSTGRGVRRALAAASKVRRRQHQNPSISSSIIGGFHQRVAFSSSIDHLQSSFQAQGHPQPIPPEILNVSSARNSGGGFASFSSTSDQDASGGSQPKESDSNMGTFTAPGSNTAGLPPIDNLVADIFRCLLYTSPSPRDQRGSRMPSSA